MKFTVYHAKNPTFGMGDHPEFNEENYEKVAEVDSDSLGEVFRITNHIEDAWWKNKEVLWHKDGSRSTSVGDVVTDGAGFAFRCEMAGWSKISRWGKPCDKEPVSP